MNEPEEGPVVLTTWQRTELGVLALVIVVQVSLYRVSVVVAAAWGLLVPLLGLHVYTWMAPLIRRQPGAGREASVREEHPD